MRDENAVPVVARRIVVHGRVQGVSFRASACSEADRLGLRGWVRNRLDGTVEALVVGPHETVEAFTAWARKGPPGARVDRVDIEVAIVEAADGAGFEVRRTI